MIFQTQLQNIIMKMYLSTIEQVPSLLDVTI